MTKMPSFLWRKFSEVDKEIFNICEDEKEHQNNTLPLNANDNITSKAVLEAASSLFVNCYPENYKKDKYLKRTFFHDKIENVANVRALKLFDLDEKFWSVNLRPVSGTSANLISFLALAGVKGKILGLKEEFGGHHSFTFKGNSIQNTFLEKIFEIESFEIKFNGEIDYENIEKKALECRPDIIIAGAYAVSVDFDYEKMKKIANKTNSILIGDISHPAGLILHGLMNNPFKFCDVVTGVFHKTFGGPRAGFIFCKKELEKKIYDASTILCGNAHTHIMVQQAVAIKEAMSSKHKRLSKKIIRNSRKLRKELIKRNFSVFKTECHIILIDLKCPVLSFVFEFISDRLGISLNRNTISSHPNFCEPTAIRIGTTGYTKRKIPYKYIPKVAQIFAKIRNISEGIIKSQTLDHKNMHNLKEFFFSHPDYKKVEKFIKKILKNHPVPHLKHNT